MKPLILAALAALIAGSSAGSAVAKSPVIRLDHEAICALFEEAGHRDCPDYELVRTSKSGKVLIPAILAGSLSSPSTAPTRQVPSGPVTVPIER